MLTLHKLEIFTVVVQTGSFSAAAEQLLMTQSAVSQHIQALEASLGVSLFKRGRRGVTLTNTGETLHTYAQQILRLVAEAESAVTDVDHLSEGQLRIGATPGISVYLLPTWMQAFRRRYPQLTVAIETDVTTQISAGVRAHRLDLGLVEGEIDSTRHTHLDILVLRDIELYVIVGKGHDWCKLDSVAAHMLNAQPFITRQQSSQTRAWLDDILAENRVEPRIVAEFDSPESIKQAVISGMGISILPDYAFQREQDLNMLKVLPVTGVNLHRSLKLLWNRDLALAPIARAFLRELAAEFPVLRQSEKF